MQNIILESSVTGLFRITLIVLVIYVVYSLLIRFVIPRLMKKYINDFQQKFSEQNQGNRNNAAQKKEGEVSIKYVNKEKKPSTNPEDGEYIDYEEIK